MKINQLKYLVLVPVLVGMLFYSSCSNDEDNFNFNKVNKTSKKAFMCLNCSGMHRSIGVHLSFVRSVNVRSVSCPAALCVARCCCVM